MSRKLICLVGAMLLAGTLTARGDGGRTVLKTDGYIESATGDDTHVFFTLQQVPQRFVIDLSLVADPNAVAQALVDSSKQGRSLSVRYDPDTAVVDHRTFKPTFVVRSLVFADKTIEADETTVPRTDVDHLAPWEQAEFALSRGVAYAQSGDNEKARPLLDQALREPDLVAPLKALALRARSGLIEDDGMSRWPAGDERDRALVAALDDARAWRQIAPGDVHAAGAVAWKLSLLGAYDEALAVYSDMMKRWPEENYLTLRGIAAIHRDNGNPALALDDLDKLAAIEGQADTMPYRYHRAWTLSEMGRWEEAISELTIGLTFQPDYDGAFWRRACAYAATGRLQEALNDFQTAAKIRSAFLQSYPSTPGTKFDEKRFAEAQQTLVDALRKSRHQKITGLCKGYWNWGDEPRARSKLLPPSP
jgi:tetratricopeptide (TPR) repeat protein